MPAKPNPWRLRLFEMMHYDQWYSLTDLVTQVSRRIPREQKDAMRNRKPGVEPGRALVYQALRDMNKAGLVEQRADNEPMFQRRRPA